MTQAVIFIGAQAAGKSSFYLDRFFRTHVRINLDMLKTRHRERILFEACLATQQRLVIDNTNATAAQRAYFIRAAKAASFEVVGYYFRSRSAECLARNASRPLLDRVPDRAILGTCARLELPRKDEGFDRLYYVQALGSGAFQIDDWLDEAPTPVMPPLNET